MSEFNLSKDSISELFSDTDSIAAALSESSEEFSPNFSPHQPSPVHSGSDIAVNGSIMNDRLDTLSEDEGPPKKTFKFRDRRLKSDAIDLPPVRFRTHFRMTPETFEKLHEETCQYFPQGNSCFFIPINYT